MSTWIRIPLLVSLLSSALATPAIAIDVPTVNTTEWRFTGDSGALIDSVYGPGTLVYGDGDGGATDTNDVFGVSDGVTIPHIGGVPVSYLNFKARTAATEGYLMRPNIESPLDLGIFEFTMVFDMYIDPSNNDPMLGIWNGNAWNQNNSELFLTPVDEAYWAGAPYAGTWQRGEWNRFVFVNDYTAGGLQTMYLNGSPVAEFSDLAIDWLWDGQPLGLWILTDDTPAETSAGYIANFALVDELLDAATISALGGANFDGIFEVCTAGPPSDLACVSSGDDVELTFTNNGPYDGGIEVYRDAALVDVIADPLATSYTDSDLCLGNYEYVLRALSTTYACSSWSTEACQVSHGFASYASQGPPIYIPDADPIGISDTIDFADSIAISKLWVEIQLSHTWIGDLDMTLTSPAGTALVLKQTGGGDYDNIYATFADDGQPYQVALLPTGVHVQPEGPGAMADFAGEDTLGLWRIDIADTVANDVGQLNRWIVTEYAASCPVTAPIDLDATPSGSDVMLTWNNDGNSYDSIEIERDGTTAATLPGTATSYVDTGLTAGLHTYQVIGFATATTPCCSGTSEPATAAVGITDLVWAAEDAAGPTDSVQVLVDTLTAAGHAVATTPAILSSDLTQYERVWVQLGTYPNNHVLDDPEGQALKDFALSGVVGLYVEGGDTWGYDVPTPLDDIDGTSGSADGIAACDVPTVIGYDSGIDGGLDLSGVDPGVVIGECSWIDHLETDSVGAVVVQVSQGPAGQNISIFFDGATAGLGEFKVITSSVELGAFEFPQELMQAYVLAFDAGGPVDPFRRGDANDDGAFDISDAVYALASLFTPGSPAPPCADAADSNDDGTFDISDAIYTLAALFTAGSSPPPAPHPDCGDDPTSDGLDCTGYSACP